MGIREDWVSTLEAGNALPAVPVMTREAFALAVGLPIAVFIAQCERGYWPVMKIGKRSLVNVELIRNASLRNRSFPPPTDQDERCP